MEEKPVALVLLWLKNNWKLVAIGLAILTLVSYIGILKWEASYYKSKYENARADLVHALAREDALEATNAGITAKYDNTLALLNLSISNNEKTNKELIEKDEELNNTRITLNAVRLFNNSKRDPSLGQGITTTVKRDDGRPNSTASSGDSAGNPESKVTVPLSVIFSLVATNDANHWKCVKQVRTWQSFWRDYEQAVIMSEMRGP